MPNKTLIGKNNYLFLINDSGRELDVHCENLNLIKDIKLSRYSFDNFCIVIFPNKSYLYRDFLPSTYDAKYRPAFELYQSKFNNKIMDGYELLKYEKDVYYKTDTHINLKGNYIIYKHFIHKINNLFDLRLLPKQINIQSKTCFLEQFGIGDLTWPINLGDQKLEDISDIYFYSDDIIDFYNFYKIQKNKNILFLNYELIDETEILEQQFVDWNIMSNYIIYIKNTEKEDCRKKIIIFYDSFLLNILPLYFELFYEVYMIKASYNNGLINLIKPDYVFEFRVERFLT
jgi:hypothetical protein